METTASVGHLLVEAQDGRPHLLERGAGDDHQVGLARRSPQHLGTKAGEIEARRHARHHLDETTGEAEEHRPEAVGASPVDRIVEGSEDDVVGKTFAHPSFLAVRPARGPQSRPPIFQR
jgi:hypothetical protein